MQDNTVLLADKDLLQGLVSCHQVNYNEKESRYEIKRMRTQTEMKYNSFSLNMSTVSRNGVVALSILVPLKRNFRIVISSLNIEFQTCL